MSGESAEEPLLRRWRFKVLEDCFVELELLETGLI